MEEADVRKVAREEIASLCGLVLRRCRKPVSGGTYIPPELEGLASIFGEALRDFSGTPDEPGEVTPGQS